MGKIISKLTHAIVVLVFFAAATTASNAQTSPKSSYIYTIGNDGEMKWYCHKGAATGAGLETPGAWQGANLGGAWNDYSTVFPGGLNTIYLIRMDGRLEWREHQGARTGLDQWGEARTVGRGWNGFKQVFSGGDGIIYVITTEGSLRWYKHNGYLSGTGLETPNAWEGPKEVGHGWGIFKTVFAAGNGIIYAITQDGKLRWYKHNGYQTGAGLETAGAWEGPKEVGNGWGIFKTVFSAGDGIIYAITQDGKLNWYKHNGYLDGRGLESPGAWENRKEVGHGWGGFVQVFALLPGSRPDSPTPSSSSSADNIGRDSFDKLKARHALQPENSIMVSVRYKTDYGYLGSTNAFGDVGPTSCSAFSVSAFVGDGAAQQLNPNRISSDSKMEVIAGYYFCNYLVSDVPLNQPIRVSVRFSSFDKSVPWSGGSQGQPPPGQQRTIIIVSGRDGGPLTLTATQPRARQLFEMVYAPLPQIR